MVVVVVATAKDVVAAAMEATVEEEMVVVAFPGSAEVAAEVEAAVKAVLLRPLARRNRGITQPSSTSTVHSKTGPSLQRVRMVSTKEE